MKRGEIWTVSGGAGYAGKPRPAPTVHPKTRRNPAFQPPPRWRLVNHIPALMGNLFMGPDPKRHTAFLLPYILVGCTQSMDYETPVKRALRDPGSAQFTDVSAQQESACGFVNSKNGFGGYAGAVPFVVVGTNPDTASVRLLDSPTADDVTLVEARCIEPTKSLIHKHMTKFALDVLKD